MEAAALKRSPLLPRSRRVLAALSDERLVKEAQRGSEAAFEVIYDRYHRPLLAFCRHMLGSREDAEDALQQTFASALRALPRNDRPAQLKAWLYTIARNRSLSILRARREQPSEEIEQASFDGLSEEVEQRAELQQLLADVHELPEKQRAALVLAEVSDLKHSQVAEVLDCKAKQVKALVFQARTALLQSREARETPCTAIREEIASATGAGLRRGHLSRHVRSCEGCAEFEREVRAQRAMLAVALPVIPTLGLKDAALAAAGIGGGGAAGGAAGGGGGLIAALGASSAGKFAAVAIATGTAVGGVAATEPGVLRSATSVVAQAATTVSQAASGELDREQAEQNEAERSRQTQEAAEAERRRRASEERSPTGAATDRRSSGRESVGKPSEAGSPAHPSRGAGGRASDGPNRGGSKFASPGASQAAGRAGNSRGGGGQGARGGTRRSGGSGGSPLTAGRRLSPGRVVKSGPQVPRGAGRVVPIPRRSLGRSQGGSKAPPASGDRGR